MTLYPTNEDCGVVFGIKTVRCSAFFVAGAFGLVGLFSIYTAVCVVSVSFIFFLVPETKNRSLEEISEALSSGA